MKRNLLSVRQNSPIMNIGLLHVFFNARHPAFDIDVGHFLSRDRCFLQNYVTRVPDDTTKNETETDETRIRFKLAIRHFLKIMLTVVLFLA